MKQVLTVSIDEKGRYWVKTHEGSYFVTTINRLGELVEDLCPLAEGDKHK